MEPSALVLNVLYALALAMNMFIIAAGLSLIFGVLRVINFAHGAFYMVGAYLMYTVTKLAGGNFWLGVAGAGLGMAAIALAIERGLLRFLYGKEHLMQLLFSFAIVLLLGDVVKMIWGADQYSVDYPKGFAGAVDLGIVSFPSYLLLLCALGPSIAVVMWLVIDR